ncbi:MAG: hypothetical protein A2847_02220 [Candidatus Sungbacteria bacterium RIFCSPHIGHO2_01_FULL_50_25]|uniref:Endolytic murein transglycosylase n=1 Tax=Candidatus Sungbacteria bacterium RIFCSPHIGHO2_01_FULL_50_25 TaxID=1802265 RepID=A0A1G2K977_9BACT|nr:MAG: hypothetical protein A2847_02220 [Candidatus Sungbacteria bacterium RIFCSPHIGHO2_01_FULL_50_25]
MKRFAPQFSQKNMMIVRTISYGALGITLIALFFVYAALFGPADPNAEPEQFVIPLDAKNEEIATRLKEEGFIKSERMLAFALGWKLPQNTIEPGGYTISKSMTPWELASVFSLGSYLKWVVIREGTRKEEIAEILQEKLNWSNEEKENWISTHTAERPAYVEGVYFPDTYLIPKDETPAEVARRLQSKFDEKFAPFAKEALKQNVRWTTALKIASLIQREAAGKADMPLIAGILWNRLLDDMKLEVDATIQYARGKTSKGWWTPITPEDKKIDSPFNTYKYKGLPPHPIANPGINAITAALYPKNTKCFFYIHDNRGNIHCAQTYKDHLRNINTYLK